MLTWGQSSPFLDKLLQQDQQSQQCFGGGGVFAPHFHKAGIVHWLYYHHIVYAAFSLSTKHESLFYVNVLPSMAVQYCKQEWNSTWAEAIFYVWAVLSFLIK